MASTTALTAPAGPREAAPASGTSVDAPEAVEPPLESVVTPSPAESVTAEPARAEPAAAESAAAETVVAEPVAAVPADAAAKDVVDVEAVGAPTTVEPALADEVEIPAAGSTVEAPDATVEPAPAVATSLVEPTGQESPATDTVVDAVPAPEASAPAPEASDDLRRIEGVGPKMAAALQAAGIRTYRQLAEIDEAALREAVKNAGLRAAPSLPMWPQRAKALVNGATETPVPATTGSTAQGDEASV